MANTDAPRGATPVNRSGANYTGNVERFEVDSSNGTAIFVGDFVVQEADGNVTPATAGTSNKILGAVTSVKVDLSVGATEHPGYLPASTSGKVYVALAQDGQYFRIQEDGTLGSNARGARAEFVAGSGDTNTGRSAHEVDSSSEGTGTTKQLQLIDAVDSPDNDISSANAEWIVAVNLPQRGAGTAGI